MTTACLQWQRHPFSFFYSFLHCSLSEEGLLLSKGLGPGYAARRKEPLRWTVYCVLVSTSKRKAGKNGFSTETGCLNILEKINAEHRGLVLFAFKHVAWATLRILYPPV